MRKLFTILFAALLSASMYATQTEVTIGSNDLHSGTTCKKDGVTMTAAGIDDVDAYITGPISFSTELGNFIKIEIQAIGAYVTGEGWTGDNYKKTWTGSASIVESEGNISTLGHIICTIELPSDYEGEGTEQSPYQISSAEDWNTFATRVSEGNTYSGVYFQLTDDIAISTMIGADSDHAFNGNFDGNGHTLTATLSGGQFCAPFAYTYGATIKNLHTTGTITTASTQAGGVVGRNGTGSLTLVNVSSDMTINASVEGASSHGGLVGYTINANLSGCAFTGKLLGKNSIRFGGLVGWKTNTAGSSITITDCLFAPAEVTMGATGSKTFVVINGGDVTITNCYYAQAFGTDQGKQLRAITAGEGVTVANAGEATVYTVSGITAYGTGILYDGVLYGGNEVNISLTLSGSNEGYTASTGTLSGNANPYTLTMADDDCEIQAKSKPTDIENKMTNLQFEIINHKSIKDGQLLIEHDGKVYNAQGVKLLNR